MGICLMNDIIPFTIDELNEVRISGDFLKYQQMKKEYTNWLKRQRKEDKKNNKNQDNKIKMFKLRKDDEQYNLFKERSRKHQKKRNLKLIKHLGKRILWKNQISLINDDVKIIIYQDFYNQINCDFTN